jgi:micrococcal nuclease
MYEYRAEVIRVIDGDTLALMVDLGCDVHVGLTVRLKDIDTPERGTPEGVAATEFVKDWLARHAVARGRASGEFVVNLVTHKDKREKYGRYLGDIYAGGTWLNEDLVAYGHAERVAYG